MGRCVMFLNACIFFAIIYVKVRRYSLNRCDEIRVETAWINALET